MLHYPVSPGFVFFSVFLNSLDVSQFSKVSSIDEEEVCMNELQMLVYIDTTCWSNSVGHLCDAVCPAEILQHFCVYLPWKSSTCSSFLHVDASQLAELL